MARNVTVTLQDGTQHTYQNVPDNVTPDAINARASSDFKQSVTNIDGGKSGSPPPMDVGSFLKTAGSNLIPDAVNTAKSLVHAGHVGFDIATDPFAGKRALDAVVQAAPGVVQHATDIAKGAVQRMRDMSPADLQGDAPRMDTTAYDNFADSNYNKFGTVQNAMHTVAAHPVGSAIAAGSVVLPALKAVGAGDAVAGLAPKVADALDGVASTASGPVQAAASAGSKLANQASDVLTAGRRSIKASDAMRDLTDTALTDQGAAHAASAASSTADAATAADDAQKWTDLARSLRARGQELDAQRAEAVAQSKMPTPSVGDEAQLSDLGDQLRASAMDNQAKIVAERNAADAQYRTAMKQVADEQAANGVGVSDMPTAQNVIKQSESLLNPSPVRPSVGYTMADDAGAKLHQRVLKGLAATDEPVTAEDAAKLRAMGETVNELPDGSFTHTVKPDLQTVDELRRYLGEVGNGQVEGYGALQRLQAQQLYKGVSTAMDEYVNGASAPVQANWAASKKALAPFENVKAGQMLTGVQTGTNVAAVPSSSIPGRMLAGGKDVINQVAAAAGQEPVDNVLRSLAQSSLAKAKTADAAAKMVAPGTKLGDAIATNSDLADAVAAHLNDMRTAEAAGARAKDLASQVDTHNALADSIQSRIADKLSASVGKLNANAADASAAALETQRQLQVLRAAPPNQVGAQYRAMIDNAYRAGKMTDAEYTAGLNLQQTAEKAFATKAGRDKWLLGATGLLGAGGLTKGALSLMTGGH